MLRALKTILPSAGQHIPRRRRHQFVPSIAGSAANLEGRTMLSGAGGAAVAHVAVDHAMVHHRAAHHAMARHAALHHHRHVHHAMARFAALHHHTQVHHAMARHAAAHHARFHAAARPAVLSTEQRVVAERKAFAAATGAAAPHDPIITSANSGGGFVGGSLSGFASGFPAGNISGGTTSGLVVPGAIAGPNGTTNSGAGAVTPATYNGYGSVAGGLPAALQNSYRVMTGLGVPEPQVVAQFGANSAINRGFQLNPNTTGNTAFTAANNTALASELASLLGTTGMTASAGIGNSVLGAELANLLTNLGTTTTGTATGTGTFGTATGTGTFGTATGTGTLAESPLAALLLGGQVPTAGTTTTAALGTTAFNGSLGQLFPSLLPINTPVNPSPLPLNGVLPFSRSPINPSPVPFNGVLTGA